MYALCLVCTQSTVTKCSATYLNSVLKTGYGMKAAYCNDKYLIIHSSGVANHVDGLGNIPSPPGEGGVDYSVACVTRSYHSSYLAFSIPLNYQLLPSSNITNNVAAFVGQTNPTAITGFGLPDSGPLAVSVSGMNMYPLYNNQGQVSAARCEMDKCSAHAGQGFDYHYHGDPFDTTAGNCMYSPADYGGYTTHPPLIGWSLDGLDIYGRYLYDTNLGYSVALDVCGGHIHNDASGVAMEYHYHAQTLSGTFNNQAYEYYVGGPYQCWRGNISKAVFFNAGNLQDAHFQPCCSTTEYYTASGISLPISATSSPTFKVTSSPTTMKSPTSSPSVAPILPTTTPTVKPSQPSIAPIISPTSTPVIATASSASDSASLSTSSVVVIAVVVPIGAIGLATVVYLLLFKTAVMTSAETAVLLR